MGSGSGSSGKHPRSFNRGDQQTLTQTGVWCYNCDTCAKPGHCRCLDHGGTGFCETCAKYHESVNVDDMIKLRTHVVDEKCSVCDEAGAEYKAI